MKYSDAASGSFVPWQPSTWPVYGSANEDFIASIEEIFKQTITQEIDNVISDANQANGSLVHRGHVIALAQMCAIDTLSSYAFYGESTEVCEKCLRTDSKIKKYRRYINEFFPEEYRNFDLALYKLYRNAMVHSWNLFEGSLLPDETAPKINNGSLLFGILNLQNALKISINNFLDQLVKDKQLQENVLHRYIELQGQAKSL